MNRPHDFDDDEVPRRSFVSQLAAFLTGFVVTAVPAAIAAVFVANPVYRKPSPSDSAGSDGEASSDGFIPLSIPPEAVPGDGTPISVTVVKNTSDAWNHYPQQKVGTIWLRRDEKSNLVAFSSICPHLGCRVLLQDQGQPQFFCPCHDSEFTLEGQPTNRIPPRPMDRLETKLVKGRILVRYIEFRGGLKEQIPV